MARIRTYQSNPVLPHAVDDGSAIIGRSLQGLGQAGQKLADSIYTHDTRMQVSKMSADFATAQADLTNQLERAVAGADPNAASEMLDKFKTETLLPAIDKIGEGNMTTDARRQYDQMRAQATAHFTTLTHAAGVRLSGVAAAENWQKSQNAYTSALTTAPATYEGTLKQMDLGIDGFVSSGLMSREDALKAKTQAHEVATISAVDGWILNKKPQQALDYLRGGLYDEHISGIQKAALINKAEAAIRATQDEDLGLARFQFADDMARVAAGGAPQYRQWTEEEAAALGGHKADGGLNQGAAAQYLQTMRTAVAVGGEHRANPDASIPERFARAQNLRDGALTSPDFRVAAEQAEAAQQAAQQFAAEYAKAPLATTIKNDPGTAQAWNEYARNPAPQTLQAAINISVAQQNRYNPGGQPQVLPDAYISQFAQRIGNIQAPGGDEIAVKAIGELQRETGPWFDKAVRDLNEAKALPPDAYVAANLMSTGRGVQARDLLRAAQVKREDLIALAGGSKEETRLEEKLRQEMEPVRASLAPLNGGLVVYNNMVKSATTLALYRRGNKQEVNVKALVKELYTNGYNFSGALQIPSTIDAKKVTNSTAAITRALTFEDIRTRTQQLGVDVDFDLSSLKAHGFWVRTEDGGGAQFMDEANRPVFIDTPYGPQPLRKTWNELTPLSLPVAPSEPAPPPFPGP